ncbi:MAG: hypothetical protein R3A13_02385 [Bdellovibrionota bacterium]
MKSCHSTDITPREAESDHQSYQLPTIKGITRRDMLGYLFGVVLLARTGRLFADEDSASEERKLKMLYGVEPELQKEIDKAISTGINFITSKQDQRGRDRGSFSQLYSDKFSKGHQLSLILYTLLSCGVKPDNEIIKNAMQAKEFGRLTDHSHLNYGFAIHVLFYSKYIDALEKEHTDEDGKISGRARGKIRKAKEEISGLISKFESSQANNVWRYPGGLNGPIVEDLSATQYVLLALQAAQRVGVMLRLRFLNKHFHTFLKTKKLTD